MKIPTPVMLHNVSKQQILSYASWPNLINVQTKKKRKPTSAIFHIAETLSLVITNVFVHAHTWMANRQTYQVPEHELLHLDR